MITGELLPLISAILAHTSTSYGILNEAGQFLFVSRPVLGLSPETVRQRKVDLTSLPFALEEQQGLFATVQRLAQNPGLEAELELHQYAPVAVVWQASLWSFEGDAGCLVGLALTDITPAVRRTDREVSRERVEQLLKDLISKWRTTDDTVEFYAAVLHELRQTLALGAAGLYLGTATEPTLVAGSHDGLKVRLPQKAASRLVSKQRVSVRYAPNLDLPTPWSGWPAYVWLPITGEGGQIGGLLLVHSGPIGWERIRTARLFVDYLELFLRPDTLRHRLRREQVMRETLLAESALPMALVNSRAEIVQTNQPWVNQGLPARGDLPVDFGTNWGIKRFWSAVSRSRRVRQTWEGENNLRVTTERVSSAPNPHYLITLGEVVPATLDAARLDQMKDVFVAHVSHELRSPLTVLKGHISLLEREAPVEQAESWRAIDHHLHRLERLVEDVLDLTQLEYGQVGFDCREVELPSLVQRVAEACSTPEIAVEANSTVLWINNDPDRLEQVLTNLVGNAVKHTPAGKRVWLTVAPGEGETVTITVRDEGEGMTVAMTRHVFDRFYKGSETKSGVGLGLSIVDSLVTHMGGSIAVASKKGQGSTFTVTLPRTMSR